MIAHLCSVSRERAPFVVTLEVVAPGLSAAIERIWGAAPTELVRTSTDPRAPLTLRTSLPGAPALDALRLP